MKPWPKRGTPELEKLQAEEAERNRKIEELLRTGTLTVRLIPEQAKLCWEASAMNVEDLEKLFTELHAKMLEAKVTSALPEEVDLNALNAVLLRVRLDR